MAKNRVQDLKTQDFNRKLQELLLNHAMQKQEKEQYHVTDYQSFNLRWDEALIAIQKKDGETISSTEQSHFNAMERNRVELESTLPLHFKASPELLNQQKIQL